MIKCIKSENSFEDKGLILEVMGRLERLGEEKVFGTTALPLDDRNLGRITRLPA